MSLVMLVGMFASQLHAAAETEDAQPAPPPVVPEGAKVVSIEVVPRQIELTNRYAYNQLLVTARLDSGQTVDATRDAVYSGAEGLLQISPRGLARPTADGSAVLHVVFQEQAIDVPVSVAGFDAPYQVSYIRDVAPSMSKLGCNAGTCHGSAQGKNGFKLSLRGYDPIFDHRALTDDLASRRFNRAAPDKSLMLLKPAGGVPHAGGTVMHPGEPNYDLLRAWIVGGVKLDLETPRVTSIEVTPAEREIALPGMQQQLRVMATYADGLVRDVTAEAFLESSQTEVVTVDSTGLITAKRRGESSLLARYEGSYSAARIVVMGDRSGFEWSAPPAFTHLDELVFQKLQKLKIQPSELCTDAEFVRRVYLDLTGIPPTADEVRAFLADTRETRIKRDELIDRLVGGPAFIEHWTNKWADMLQVNRKFLGEEGSWALRNWIRQALSQNMPYDQFVYQVLTASGSNLENPPAAYYKVLRDPGTTMENTTQLFLAIRFNCNKCHDHPFERWTQDQYYDLAAYFAQIGRKPAAEFGDRRLEGSAVDSALPLVEIIYDSGAGEVAHERTGAVRAPNFPYKHDDMPADSAARREQLAKWITSVQNPYFAKSYVNRLWSYLLGVGLIEPIDDIRAGNPPSNPELLDRLTRDFIDSGFDARALFRSICKSRVYQQSVETNKWNEDDEANFSHALARRLPAETLYDAVHAATGSQTELPGVPRGFHASETADSNLELPDSFLALFGRPPRESACECERSTGVMLGQALNLVNGPTIAEAINDPANRITKLTGSLSDDGQLVDELFLSILNRPAKPEERDACLGTFTSVREELAMHEAELAKYEREVQPARQAEFELSLRPTEWQVLAPETMQSSGGATLTRRDDGSIAVEGANPETDTLTLATKLPAGKVTGVRIEVLPDDSLPAKGPGRAANGNFVLNEIRATLTPAGGQPQPVALKGGVADFSQEAWAVPGAADGNAQSGWAIAPKFGEPHTAVFETAADLEVPADAVLTLTLEQNFGQKHTIGRMRVSVTTSPRPLRLEGPPAEIVDILAIVPAQRTPEQAAKVAGLYHRQDRDWQVLNDRLQLAKSQHEQFRLTAAQDIAWALINSPAFLFNR